MFKRLINKKNVPYVTIPITIVAFVILSMSILNYSGITNILSDQVFAYINQDNIQQGVVAGVGDTTQWRSKFDAPYPRMGQLYFYAGGKADADLWKNFGMVAIRNYYKLKQSHAEKIRYKNPNVILLAATDDLRSSQLESFLGKELPDDWIVHRPNGDEYIVWSSPLSNITKTCPDANFQGKTWKFNEFYADLMFKKMGSAYDGVFVDGWVTSQLSGDIDFNNDKQAENNVFDLWREGSKKFVSNFRSIAGSGVPIIGHEDSGNDFLNGNGFEFWSQVGNPPAGHASNLGLALNLNSTAVDPVILYCNSEAGGKSVQKKIKDGHSDVASIRKYGYDKLSGSAWRADFTSAQMAGCFSGHDSGGDYSHLYPIMHDEYEGDLGYPLGNARQIKGVWVRYFDKGVVISNISGSGKNISAGDLDNRTYYRFLGNQEPAFNNGKQFTSVSLAPMDGIMMLTEQLVLINPIIIDNMEYNVTSANQDPVKYTGSWLDAKQAGQLGDDYYFFNGYQARHSGFSFSSPGSGENIAEYAPEIFIPGEYEIFEWHGSIDGQTMASNVPYEVYINNSLVEIKTVNQQENQGGWNSLGTFDINQGEQISVKISNNANGYITSDAIKFVNLASFIKEYDGPPPDDPDVPKVLKADFNCDGKIDIQDFGILLSHWHEKKDKVIGYKHSDCSFTRSIDIVKDKRARVDYFDLSSLLSCWETPLEKNSPECWMEQPAVVE
jgi:hypothetical protein